MCGSECIHIIIVTFAPFYCNLCKREELDFSHFSVSHYCIKILFFLVSLSLSHTDAHMERHSNLMLDTIPHMMNTNLLFIVSANKSKFYNNTWISYCRYMLGLAAIPAVIQFFGFLFLPESPRWLIQKGQTQKARRILSQMRGNQTIDEEYDSIKNNIEEEEKEVGSGMYILYLYEF